MAACVFKPRATRNHQGFLGARVRPIRPPDAASVARPHAGCVLTCARIAGAGRAIGCHHPCRVRPRECPVDHLASGWLVSPGGSRGPLTSSTQSLRIDQGRALEVRWTFELDAATWTTADAKGWFHVPAKARGPVAAGCDPAKGVRVEARLGAEHLHALREPLRQFDGPRAVAAVLLTLGDDHLLRATEAWWGLAATTEYEAGGRMGFSSPWKDVETILPPALPLHVARFSAGGLVSYL